LSPSPGLAPARPWSLTRLRALALLAGLILLSLALAARDGAAGDASQVPRLLAYDLAHGRAQAAWQLIQIASPSVSTDAALLSPSALSASLAQGTGGRLLESGTLRNVAPWYAPEPDWRIRLQPLYLSLVLPSGYDHLTVDGLAVPTPGAGNRIAVLPLLHRVQAVGGPRTLSVSTLVRPSAAGAQPQLVPRLRAPAQVALEAAVRQAFENCTQISSPTPAGCPQFALLPGLASVVRWSLAGDPAQDLLLDLSPSGQWLARGRFQMILSYTLPGSPGVHHLASTGAFSASLTLPAGVVTLATLVPASDPAPPPRPEQASDTAALAAAAAGLVACAGATTVDPPDCPQAGASILAPGSGVTWTLLPRSPSVAHVTYGAANGIYTVSGPYAMATARGQRVSGGYQAQLLWVDGAFQLVTISGSSS